MGGGGGLIDRNGIESQMLSGGPFGMRRTYVILKMWINLVLHLGLYFELVIILAK